jgi:NRPS condensation-like uncharacterized protein
MSSHTEVAGRCYRLDNAANVYPAIKSRKRPNLFRLSATLEEPVVPERLQQALDRTLDRIPSFSVRMRSGLFWHYFSQSEERMRIHEDVINPCICLTSGRDHGFQIRVRHHDRRIGLEIFHSVSDGAGAMAFLKTLVAQYLALGGVSVTAQYGVLSCEGSSTLRETADDFGAFAGHSTSKRERQRRAYHVTGTKLAYHEVEIITGTVPVEAIKAESKRRGVSITEYLTGVYLFILNDFQRAEQRRRPLPVTIQVPVNLRQFHPSETLRNFSSYVCPSIDPTQGDYTFEEILSSVHHFMRYEITGKQLRSRVATNIRTERNALLRMLPLFAKNQAISLGYKFAGPAIFTSVLSNLGMVQVPAEMAAHVEMLDFLLGPSQVTNVDCAVLGYKGKLRINFTRVIEEPFVERAFFTFLVRQGIPVKVESNKEQTECPIA